MSLRRAFEIGLARGRIWTLCIDADVLVTERGVRELVAVAERQADSVFEVQGLIADKFFGFLRPAGNHLYRTQHLEKGIQCIPHQSGVLRPEHSTILRMREHGYQDIQLPVLVGLHDFEQTYQDIYRKCFLQARKHEWLKDFLLDRWSSQETDDPDYRVAVLAFIDGQSSDGEICVSKQIDTKRFEHALGSLGLSEKSPLSSDAIDGEYIAKTVLQFMLSTNQREIREQANVWNHYFCPKPKSHLKAESRASIALMQRIKSRFLRLLKCWQHAMHSGG